MTLAGLEDADQRPVSRDDRAERARSAVEADRRPDVCECGPLPRTHRAEVVAFRRVCPAAGGGREREADGDRRDDRSRWYGALTKCRLWRAGSRQSPYCSLVSVTLPSQASVSSQSYR